VPYFFEKCRNNIVTSRDWERWPKAEHTYQCCQRKIVKKIGEDLPDIGTAISVLKNQKQYNRVKQKESN